MIKPRLKTKDQWDEATYYLKETKGYIFFAIILFIASSFIGYFFRADLSFLDEILREIILKTQDLNTPQMIFFILQNNLLSALITVLGGLLFGIYPLFNAVINGTVLGYVLGIAADEVGFLVWWRLLPHGIFELPAIFISIGLGIKLGFSLFTNHEVRSQILKERFYQSANTFLMIVIPLLIIAAIIEGILIVLIG